MPRVTIKSLEDQINSMRATDQRNKIGFDQVKTQLKMTEDRVKELGKETTELRRDKEFLQTILSQITKPRNPNALPR